MGYSPASPVTWVDPLAADRLKFQLVPVTEIINAVSSATAEHARAADSTAATFEAVAGDIRSVRIDVEAIAATTAEHRNEIRTIAESTRQLSSGSN